MLSCSLPQPNGPGGAPFGGAPPTQSVLSLWQALFFFPYHIYVILAVTNWRVG